MNLEKFLWNLLQRPENWKSDDPLNDGLKHKQVDVKIYYRFFNGECYSVYFKIGTTKISYKLPYRGFFGKSKWVKAIEKIEKHLELENFHNNLTTEKEEPCQ